MPRQANRVRALIERSVKDMATVRKCRRILKTKYGFTDPQIAAMELAQRGAGADLANVMAIVGLSERELRGTLAPPVFGLARPRRGEIV